MRVERYVHGPFFAFYQRCNVVSGGECGNYLELCRNPSTSGGLQPR